MPTTLTAYTFDELTPEAQACALDAMPFKDCEYTAEECVDSLRAFAEKVSRSCGVSLKDWSIGSDVGRSFTKWNMEDATRELTGARSFAWIENNIFALVRQGWNIKDKGRKYYRPGVVKACPYTGVCFDEDILDAFRDKDASLTIGERFASIGGRLSRVIEADIEYCNSDEGRRERADCEFEDVLFDENGRKIH